MNIYKKFPKKLSNVYYLSTAMLACLYYGFPGNKMFVIGVTGTNGKTTTVHLISHILQNLQSSKTGYISTAAWNLGKGEEMNSLRMTMPGRFKMQKFLSEMRHNGCSICVIEATSEGLAQHRGFGLGFNVGVFTNLSPEHVESHGSFDKYREAKGKLFKSLGRKGLLDTDASAVKNISGRNTSFVSACPPKPSALPMAGAAELARCAHSNSPRAQNLIPAAANKKQYLTGESVSVINLDDKHADYFLKFKADLKYGYAIKNRLSKQYRIANKKYRKHDIKKVIAREVKLSAYGAEFKIRSVEFKTNLLGEFNVYNALAGICTALSQGMNLRQISHALKSFSGVAGRLEFIQKKPFSVIVDYAHTPDSFSKLFKCLQFFYKGRYIAVFGSAGGVRDKAKRPKLGKIASKYCDYVILTNEDPYDSDPMEILNDIKKGIKRKKVFKILDRRLAIRKALSIAEKDDLVLILGKGCEPCIKIKNKKIPWDDRIVAMQELAKLKNCG